MAHGPPLLGLRFIKSLGLEAMSAWRLTLGACSFLLAACSFFPISILRGPRFMDLIYFSVWGM